MYVIKYLDTVKIFISLCTKGVNLRRIELLLYISGKSLAQLRVTRFGTVTKKHKPT